MLNKIKSKQLRQRIVGILHSNADNRDNDFKLQANVWHDEAAKVFGTKNLEDISAFEFLKAYSLGKMSPAESIRRQRQKIQQEHKSLRGKNYFLRQLHSKKVKKKIHTV